MIDNDSDPKKIKNPLLIKLAQDIKSTIRKDNAAHASSRFALFLGAGASFNSGIIGAARMIDHFKKEIYERHGVEFDNERDEKAWLLTQEWYTKNGNEHSSDYSKFFEECYDMEPKRRSYIESIIENAEPSFGYMILANLIQAGYFKTIITTNFDDLVYIACTTFTSTRPVVYALGGFATEMTLATARPRVLKLHGDFLYSDLKNVAEELRYQDRNMAREVRKVLDEYDGLIVVGYAGNDHSVMKLLKELPKDKTVYWCYPKRSDLAESVTNFVKGGGRHLVEIDGFDEMMNTIREIVAITPGETVRHVEGNFIRTAKLFHRPEDSVALEFLDSLNRSLKILSLEMQGIQLINIGTAKAYRKLKVICNRLLKLNPGFPTAHYHLGVIKYREGDLQGALDSVTEALHFDAGNYKINMLNTISAIHKKMENNVELNRQIRTIERIIEPDDLYNQACLYANRNDHSRALHFLSRAVSTNRSYKFWARKDIEFDWIRIDPDYCGLFNEIVAADQKG